MHNPWRTSTLYPWPLLFLQLINDADTELLHSQRDNLLKTRANFPKIVPSRDMVAKTATV